MRKSSRLGSVTDDGSNYEPFFCVTVLPATSGTVFALSKDMAARGERRLATLRLRKKKKKKRRRSGPSLPQTRGPIGPPGREVASCCSLCGPFLDNATVPVVLHEQSVFWRVEPKISIEVRSKVRAAFARVLEQFTIALSQDIVSAEPLLDYGGLNLLHRFATKRDCEFVVWGQASSKQFFGGAKNEPPAPSEYVKTWCA